MQTQPSLDEAADRLEHNATYVGILPAIVVGVLLVLVHPLVGAVVGLVMAVAWVLVVRARIAAAPARVLQGVHALPLAAGRHPRLENLLEGLCVTSGVPPPEVRIIDEPGMNALVAAGRDDACLVLTSGLVGGLDRLELEGVLANLLARVKDGSARYTTTVLALLGASDRGAALLGTHLGDQRSVLSDLAAVDLTRYPPGLMSALSTMSSSGTEVVGAPPLTRSLWLAPFGESAQGEPLGAEQPLALRIAVLSEL